MVFRGCIANYQIVCYTWITPSVLLSHLPLQVQNSDFVIRLAHFPCFSVLISHDKKDSFHLHHFVETVGAFHRCIGSWCVYLDIRDVEWVSINSQQDNSNINWMISNTALDGRSQRLNSRASPHAGWSYCGIYGLDNAPMVSVRNLTF